MGEDACRSFDHEARRALEVSLQLAEARGSAQVELVDLQRALDSGLEKDHTPEPGGPVASARWTGPVVFSAEIKRLFSEILRREQGAAVTADSLRASLDRQG